MRRTPLMAGLICAIAAFGVIACSNEPFGSFSSVQIHIPAQAQPQALPLAPLGWGVQTAPSTLSGFSCLAVNVMGEGIPRTDNGSSSYDLGALRAGTSYCSYPGVTSGPISVNTGGSVDLRVPAGAGRIIQIIGVSDGASACGTSTPITSNSEDTDFYEVGRQILDLFGNKQVAITSSWNSLTAAQRELRQVDCGENEALAYSELISSHANVIGYWRLGEASGTTAFEESEGVLGDLTYVGSPTLGISGAIADDDDTAVEGFGISNRVEGAVGYNFGTANTASLTLEAWVKASTCANGKPIVQMKDAAGTSIALQCSGSTEVGFAITDSNPTSRTTSSTSTVIDGSWHHIVGVLEADVIYLYVDGQLESSSNTPAFTGNLDLSTTVNTWIGYNSVPDYFTGAIDEPAIYDSALTAAEILDHYETGAGL